MRRRPSTAAALQRGTRSALSVLPSRRALRPGNVACGDSDCGAPYHCVITRASKILLARSLSRLARRPILGPVTTGFPATGRQAAEDVFGRFGRRSGSDGRYASDRAPDEHHHGAHHRLAGAGPLDVGPAGVRRPQDTPAALDSHQSHPVVGQRQHRPGGTVGAPAAGSTTSPPAPSSPRRDTPHPRVPALSGYLVLPILTPEAARREGAT